MSLLQVDRRRGDLFNYIIFLRVTPILPNIFINIASPVVDVPLQPFALGEKDPFLHFLGSVAYMWSDSHMFRRPRCF